MSGGDTAACGCGATNPLMWMPLTCLHTGKVCLQTDSFAARCSTPASCSLPLEPAAAAAAAGAADAAALRPIRRALQQPMERDRESDGPPGAARHIHCCFIMLLLLLQALFWLHFRAIFPTFPTPFLSGSPRLCPLLFLSLFLCQPPGFNGPAPPAPTRQPPSLPPPPGIDSFNNCDPFVFLAKMVIK